MDSFGKEERDLQEEFGNWVAVCGFFAFFAFIFWGTPHGGGGGRGEEEEERQLIDCAGNLGVYGLGRCYECLGGGEGI